MPVYGMFSIFFVIFAQEQGQIQKWVGGGGQGISTLSLKFHFYGKFWIQLINLGYCLYLIHFFNKSILLPMNLCKIAG